MRALKYSPREAVKSSLRSLSISASVSSSTELISKAIFSSLTSETNLARTAANAAFTLPPHITSLWHFSNESVTFISPEYLLPGAETTINLR